MRMSNKDDINEKLNIEDSDDKKDYTEEICYLCKRPESLAGKLMQILNHIYICADCMQRTFDLINNPDNPYINMIGIPRGCSA